MGIACCATSVDYEGENLDLYRIYSIENNTNTNSGHPSRAQNPYFHNANSQVSYIEIRGLEQACLNFQQLP